MSAFVLRHNPVATAAIMSNWFDKVFGDTSVTDDGESVYRIQPKMDISEEDGKYLVSVDVPGLTKDDVGIKVENGVIKIDGERKEERKGKYYHSERARGKFMRVFSLPDDVEPNEITAKVSNGVLELELPKSKKALPVEIKIA